MDKQRAVLIRAQDGIVNGASLAYVLQMVREHFAEFNLPQPPIPNDVWKFIPSNLLISSVEDDDGKEIGTIEFSQKDGSRFYKADWTIREF